MNDDEDTKPEGHAHPWDGEPRSYTLAELTDPQLEALAIAHVQHFHRMVQHHMNDGRGVNIEETVRYLETWRTVVTKVRMFKDVKSRLGMYEASEIVDALTSGDYDDLMTEAARPGYVQATLTGAELGEW